MFIEHYMFNIPSHSINVLRIYLFVASCKVERVEGVVGGGGPTGHHWLEALVNLYGQ